MDLVVARNDFARVIEHQRGRGDPAIAAATQRNGARDNPDFFLSRERRELLLNASVRIRLGDFALIGVRAAHEREVLRQHDNARAGAGRIR